jgi:hypothetical protein
MTDQNGWPDASKPGYPKHPERSGHHALRSRAQPEIVWFVEWVARQCGWRLGQGPSIMPESLARYWTYDTALYTEAEVAAAQREGMEEAIRIILSGKEVAHTEGTTITHTEVQDMTEEEAVAAIRARMEEIKP